MTDSEIESRVIRIVAKQLGVDQDIVTSDASFEDDLGADEFEMAEMIRLFETEFQISIAEYQIGGLRNVGRIVDFVAKHGADSL